MKIYRTFDDDAIREIMFNPSIWERCAEDGQEQDKYNPETEADCWLLLETEEGYIGAYNVHPHNSTTLEIHAHILPKYRKEYAFESGDLALKWILDEAPEQYQKVIAQIPVCYQNVIDFTMAHGLVKEGVNRLSTSISGILYDMWLLGITRPEIKEYFNE